MDSQRPVTRATFRNIARLSEPIAIPPPTRRWSGKEWDLIRAGHHASEMEDKWNAFVEGDRLFLHRSWTGFGIFEADFAPDGDAWVITAAWVTGDPGVYTRSSDGYETLMLESYTAGVLLGRWPEDHSARLNALPVSRRPKLEAVLGDITGQQVDAIVNAANSALRGGGGVDGAIHRAAGPRLAEAGAALAPCQPGDAKVTPAFDLDPPVKHVIHTVGPVWRGGGEGEERILRSCYRRCLAIAGELGVHTMAFPAIATGVYGYPPDAAADVAIHTLRTTPTSLQSIRLVAYDEATYQLYLERLAPHP